MKTLLQIFTAGLLSVFIVGCSSEIDKCVDSQVTAWKETQALKLRDVQSGQKTRCTSPGEFGGCVHIDQRLQSEVEADSRLICMQVQRGKN